MLSETLRVPYRAADATGTLLVGAVLTGLTVVSVVGWLALFAVEYRVAVAVTPVVILFSLLIRGYLLRVVVAGIAGEIEAPSFVRWGALLQAGSKSAVVSTIYLLPAAVFLGVAVGAGAATVIEPEGFAGALQAVAAAAILVGGFGTLCYGLVYLYVRPAARAVLAETGSVRATLDFRRVGRISLTGPYLAGWLVAMGLLVVGPLLLLPLVVMSGVAGIFDEALAAVGVLLTLLLGVVFLFSLRLSAAWATGRGAAAGLVAVGLRQEPPSTADQAAETDTPQTEAPAAIQVGRTVATQSGWRAGFRMPRTRLTERPLTIGAYQSPNAGNTQTATNSSNESDSTSATKVDPEPETESKTEPETESENAPETDAEFEWGPTDKE